MLGNFTTKLVLLSSTPQLFDSFAAVSLNQNIFPSFRQN
jgi:hypothetical protein